MTQRDLYNCRDLTLQKLLDRAKAGTREYTSIFNALCNDYKTNRYWLKYKIDNDPKTKGYSE